MSGNEECYGDENKAAYRWTMTTGGGDNIWCAGKESPLWEGDVMPGTESQAAAHFVKVSHRKGTLREAQY